MKQALLYLLLFAYTTVMLKPVLPIVSDLLAHTFWKWNHISTVHHHDGHDHVHFEIVKIEKENLPEKKDKIHINDLSANPHLSHKINFDFTLVLFKSDKFPAFKVSQMHSFLPVDAPPPRC